VSGTSLSEVPPHLRSRRDAQGRFIVPWAAAEDVRRGPRDLLRWWWQRQRGDIAPDPPGDSFQLAVPDIAVPRCDPGELRLTWVGHATFLVQLSGVNILTDPVWSRRASPVGWAGPSRLVAAALAFDRLPPIDVVLLSHDHYDHLDSRTVRRLHERWGDAITWVTPLGYSAWLRRFGVRRVVELDWWSEARLTTGAGDLSVRAVPAQHWTKRSPFSERTRLWASFVMADASGRAVYFGGDSGYFAGYDHIGRLGPFVASLLPIGAYDPRWFMKPAHMNPEEAVRAYMELGSGGLFAGMHWGTFRLTDEPAHEPPARAAAAWRAQGLPPDRLWLPRHGESRIVKLDPQPR
jgi:N-acyl-phosphatidylethanolamine-hydrolysing phospholipase D